MVVLLATGVIPAAVTALLAAGADGVLLRVVTIEQAYRGINWTTILLVAGMLPMSTAITVSGAGEMSQRGSSIWSALPDPPPCLLGCSSSRSCSAS